MGPTLGPTGRLTDRRLCLARPRRPRPRAAGRLAHDVDLAQTRPVMRFADSLCYAGLDAAGPPTARVSDGRLRVRLDTDQSFPVTVVACPRP